jgi:hypothetical protein
MIAEEPTLECGNCGTRAAVLLHVDFHNGSEDEFCCPPCTHFLTGQTHFRLTGDEFEDGQIVDLEITVALPSGEVTRRRVPRP